MSKSGANHTESKKALLEEINRLKKKVFDQNREIHSLKQDIYFKERSIKLLREAIVTKVREEFDG
ncbi:hypothetical protein M316_0015 [Nitrincola phage 1M3-16]|uniref:hypothetical protein n=1 Tax=Nitrincola phage 1M3-16 TaxID=1472912 RepID=UPI000444B78F|nr:hypothetical protein GJ22_gp137 [Nitrincola phage 1M3-16]AHX01080.1 hypothetical protein M316_0015 [Nitrincola phage 1M3-16]